MLRLKCKASAHTNQAQNFYKIPKISYCKEKVIPNKEVKDFQRSNKPKKV